MRPLKQFLNYFIRVCTVLATIMCFSAQPVIAGQDNIRFENFSLSDGLSQENVRSIHQDSEGFMWFGTQEGVNRFDGYQFKVFSNSLSDPTSISSSSVASIAETADGRLWFATDSGVSVLDKTTQKFKRYNKILLNSGETISTIKVIFVDSHEQIWIGSSNGLLLFDYEQDKFVEVSMPLKNPGLNTIESIVEDIGTGIWIASTGHGLFRYDRLGKEVSLFTEKLSPEHKKRSSSVNKLMIDGDQRLWVGTLGYGVYLLDLQKPLTGTPSKGFEKVGIYSGLNVRALYQDDVGNIWVGTDTGLYVQDKKANNVDVLRYEINNPGSLSDDRIVSLYQDRGGVFWVGTYRGLSKWNTATAKFDYYRIQSNVSKSLSSPNINAIHDAGNDHVWVASHNGLNLLDLVSGNIKQFFADKDNSQTLKDNNITALYAPNKNLLILGYRNSGISVLDRTSNTMKHFIPDITDSNAIGNGGVTSILGTKAGDIWLGTYGGGLNFFDRQKGMFKRYLFDPNNPFSLSSNRVMTVYEDRQKMLWVGTRDGLNIFNPALNTATRILHDDENVKSLGSNFIWTIYEDKIGNIWVGTQGAGLNYLSAENRKLGIYEFERFSREQGLPSSSVYGVLPDNEGYLWLSTNRGITKFDPRTRSMLNYDSSHGLQGNEFNNGAYHKMPDGKFFFGGTNGVTAFYPEDIAPNAHVPPVVLTKFQRLNEVSSMNYAADASNRIEVTHKDYLIAFEFAGLDFASPDNNRYSYKLEGFDDDWIEARDVRKATYTNLPAGNYVFKVKASNNDGIWNEEGTNILLTVLPAPWFSWWAYSIYGMIFLAVSFWLYRSYLNKVKQEEIYLAQLENEVQKRTMELSAANEQLLNASVTDQLTGLHNRRYLANVIKAKCDNVYEEFKSYLANNEVYANEGPRLFFLMFDLDGFKPINDTYGHDAGDRVIIQVGELLQSVCREDDIVIRWGGDEFMVIGKVYDQGEVSYLAERIRETIEKYGFNIGLSQRMHLSSSIGYAMYPFAHFSPDSLSWEQVHLLADKALYKSKDAGRNTWVGMVQCAEMPPVGVMNTLTHNVEQAVKLGHVILETPESMKNAHKKRSNVSSLSSRK